VKKYNDRNHRMWTTEEDALVDLWMVGGWSTEAIADRLGRTTKSVYLRRDLLRLRARQPQDQLT
jgi:hypothetical protein